MNDQLQPLQHGENLLGWTQVCGPLETNAFLLESAGEMVVVDPAIASDALLQKARERTQSGVRLIGIWNTHGHFDHVYDNAKWKSEFPEVPLFAHPADAFFLEHLREQALWFGLPKPEIARAEAELSHTQILRCGQLEARVCEVPGHSPGSVAFDFGEFVISGDVLFAGSIGRTDLPGCSSAELANSLRRLFEFAPETHVYPGHGPATTIGAEKNSNLVARELLENF